MSGGGELGTKSLDILQRMMDNFELPTSFTFGDETSLLSKDAVREQNKECSCRVVNGYNVGPMMTEADLYSLLLPDPHFCFTEKATIREIGENVSVLINCGQLDIGTDFKAHRVLLISGPDADSPSFISFTTKVVYDSFVRKYPVSSIRQFHLFACLNSRLEIPLAASVLISRSADHFKVSIYGFVKTIRVDLLFSKGENLVRFIRAFSAAMPKPC